MTSFPFDRVAVTGGSGLLGRYVVRELMGDCSVTSIDLKPLPEDVGFTQCDTRDLDAVRAALKGHDAIVHLAALDDGIVPEEEAFIDVNLRGTWHVLQAAEELGIRRVVIASSVAAIGLGPANPPMQLPIPVDVALLPRESYGVTKKVCEEFARTFARRGEMEVICLRPPLVAQPDITYSMACIAAERDGLEPPAAASSDSWRELRETLSPIGGFITPDDAARAFRAALTADNIRYGAFFVSGPDSLNSGPTVEAVARGFGITPEVVRPEVYTRDPRATAYDLQPVFDALGWRPQDRWADHVARVIAAA
jgi:UDP-glucose 4-epimerase